VSWTCTGPYWVSTEDPLTTTVGAAFPPALAEGPVAGAVPVEGTVPEEGAGTTPAGASAIPGRRCMTVLWLLVG